MYSRILAAVNEHLNSEISARYATTLAKACGAKLYVCFVACADLPQRSIDRAEDAVKRLFIEAREAGIQVESITSCGSPVEEIAKIVRHEGISIVFASTRRQDIERRFYTGTVARSLLLTLPCSVAMVRVVHTGRVHPVKVLVPLKARINYVKERAYFTARMAQGFQSKVFVLHVPKKMTKFFHGEVHLTPAQWEKRVPADVAAFIEQMRKYGIDFESRLAPGATARNITIEAASKRHDLIIMGASERSLLASILKGNPVEDVLRETPCDLIILKPRHEDS